MKKQIIIETPERFQFYNGSEKTTTMFKRLLEDKDKDIIVILDFKKTVYIDSSGLGILLWLRNLMGEEDSKRRFTT